MVSPGQFREEQPGGPSTFDRISKRVFAMMPERIRQLRFPTSSTYWESRYNKGGDSGSGSYGRLAQFKARTLNTFVKDNAVGSVVEFGCGDGAQLTLAEYPSYLGIDVSERAVELCRTKFSGDTTKSFLVLDDPASKGACAELALSLDVIYHLVEDALFDDYMSRLVASAQRFIGIYSSNSVKPPPAPHVRHRRFTEWMDRNAPSWELGLKVDNPYPEDPRNPDQTSWSDFYFYRKTEA